MAELKTTRLRDLIGDLRSNAELLDSALNLLRKYYSEGPDVFERFVTEKFASHLPGLTAIVESTEEDFEKVLASTDFPEVERARIRKVREDYLPFKTEIQSANLFEQGYLHRITGVRHRPYVFVYSGVPAVDLTLRSFDRNLLRIVDTLDNVMGLIAGLAEAVATAHEKSMLMGVRTPDETAQRLLTHLTRARDALQRFPSPPDQKNGVKPTATESTKRSSRRGQRRKAE